MSPSGLGPQSRLTVENHAKYTLLFDRRYMSLEFNSITMAGNIVNDPELRQTGSGTAVVNFRLACNIKLSADSSKVTFIDVATFGNTAEAVHTYCKKGSNVLVTGRLDEDQWSGEDGQKRFKHFITASLVKFVSTGEHKAEQRNAI